MEAPAPTISEMVAYAKAKGLPDPREIMLDILNREERINRRRRDRSNNQTQIFQGKV